MLADQHWHQGVVGIVASRLTEKYSCPAFMICLDQGMGKGSCRSWGGVNLFEALRACSPLLESFGGHALAAGFTVREENIPALAEALRRAVATQGCCEEGCALEADALVTPQELTVEGVDALEALEPWGSGNPRPVLVLDDPFSALDRKTEEQVFDNLRKMTTGSTVLLISHRLYLFPELDQVIWLENGEAKVGTHEELEGNTPDYAAQFDAQRGEQP